MKVEQNGKTLFCVEFEHGITSTEFFWAEKEPSDEEVKGIIVGILTNDAPDRTIHIEDIEILDIYSVYAYTYEE